MNRDDEGPWSNLTREQAIALAATEWWKTHTDREIALFQLSEERLCMPFDRFHEAVGRALGRGVFTHEFARGNALLRELQGETPPPTMDEILEMIPEAKRIVVVKP